MSTKFPFQIKTLILTALLAVSAFATKAATYTAVLNGNWSSAATWGGSAPSFNINGIDAIIIPAGITVNLDNSVTFNNLLASLSVSGTLSSAGSNITVNSGSITGTGNISVPNITVGTLGSITFTGTINANSFTSNSSSLTLASQVNVSNSLYINNGILQLDNGSMVNLGANSTIYMNNSSIVPNGGSLNFSGMYNLSYNGSSGILGSAMIGGSLNNLTISLTNGNDELTLNSNLSLQGGLYLNSGSLDLNGYNLSINGGFVSTTNGSITGSANSMVSITTSADPGNISFSDGVVGSLAIDLSGATEDELELEGDLTVNGVLTLTDGFLDVGDNTLTINGTIVSTGGYVHTTNESDIVVNGTGIVGNLPINGSGEVGDLTINISANGSLGLTSNLDVEGTLTLNNGSLILNGHTLTINGAITGTAVGYIYGDSNGNVTINGTAQNNVNLTQGINNLTVNVTGSGSVTANSDVVINGALNLQSGSFMLNGHNLTINGTANTSAGAGIYGSTQSSIYINGNENVGNIGFWNNFTDVEDLVINISGANGSITLNSNAMVHGTLNLMNGVVNTGSNSLHVMASGMVQGGSADSYVISTGNGHLVMHLTNTTNAMFHVGTMANYAPVVITNNSNTAGNFGVNAIAGVYANGFTGSDLSASQSVVNTSWDLWSDISAGLMANAQFYWYSSMEANGFNHNIATVAHYYNNQWNMSGYTAATAHGSGSYSLTATGLTSFSPFAIFDENTVLSIHNVAETPTFDVFPNPTTDQVNITLGEPAKYKRVRLFNVIGKEMASIPVSNTVTTVDMTTMPAGIYFISIDDKYSRRIIKK